MVGSAGFEQNTAAFIRRNLSQAAPVPLVIPRPKSEMPSFKLESHIETLAANRNERLENPNPISNSGTDVV